MNKNKTSYLLSKIITILAIIASCGGLFLKNLYQDNAFVKMAWFTNDIITLLVVAPLLVVAIYFSNKNSNRLHLILVGLLGYVFYNFAFYLFGAAFNIFFLIYAALVSLSAFTLVLFLSQSNLKNIAINFSEKTPVKLVSIYLVFIALILFIVEFSMVFPFLISGKIPATILQTGTNTSIVFALDFTIVIPVSITAAVLLWQRNSWGFILGIMMLVKGFTYGLVLSIGTISLANSDIYGKWDSLFPLYVFIIIGGLLGCCLLLKNFKENYKTLNYDKPN
jgi:hypothetical protein